jgi:hypothetical protein
MVKKLPYFFYLKHGNAYRTVGLLETAFPDLKFHIRSKEHPYNGRFGWSIYVGHGDLKIHCAYMSPADLSLLAAQRRGWPLKTRPMSGGA